MSSTKDTPKIERDLWSVMANERLGNKDNSRTTGVILFLGDFGCGKSTIIQSFLKPSVTKEPKPTFALEYSFARKKTAGSVGKSVSQIWELGGEINNPGFLDVPLSARGICDSSVVICCDLSKPQNIFMALKRHFDLLKTVIRKRISEFQVNDQISQIAMLREYAARSLGDHPDANIIKMMEVPVFIIPTKFDLFKNIPLNDRRLIYQIIRFFAHYYGANILTSSNDASQKEVLRGHLSSICFQTPLKAMCDTAAERPLLMSAGSDSFESILLMLKGTDGESKSRLAQSEKEMRKFVTSDGLTPDCWNKLNEAAISAFGDGDKYTKEEEGKEEVMNNQFPEPEVDEMRAQRDVALAQYVQEIDRREMLARKIAQDGQGKDDMRDRESTATDDRESTRSKPKSSSSRK